MRVARLLVALVAALGLALVAAAPASAAPTKKGATGVTLNSTALGVLAKYGVAPGVYGPASLGGATATFPVVGNLKDCTVEHVGGLTLTLGETGIALGNFTIDLNEGVVSGIVDGSFRADLFTIEPGLQLALTGAAANVLNERFGVDDFAAGLVIASAATTADVGACL